MDWTALLLIGYPVFLVTIIGWGTYLDLKIVPKQRKLYLEAMDKRIKIFHDISDFILENLKPKETE